MTISEGRNLGKNKIFVTFFLSQKVWISKLFYSILGPFLMEIFEKPENCVIKKDVFFEFPKLVYSILGPFLMDEILENIENCRDFFFSKKNWFSKLFYITCILGPFLRMKSWKNRKFSWPFFVSQKVCVFKVVLLYFRTISEEWKLQKKTELFRDIFFYFEFSKLFYTILGPFLRDEIFEKFLDQKIFFKKFEFSKLIYSTLGPFLRDGILEKSREKKKQKTKLGHEIFVFFSLQDFIPPKIE